MKSARRSSDAEIDAFWTWFATIAGRFEAQLDDGALLRELERRIHDLSSELSWEVGPGASKPVQLVISPNLDREMRLEARRIVSRAPQLDDWEFHAARQPRDWNYRFELGDGTGGGVELDAGSWTFVLLRYPDATHEILLKGTNLASLSDEERWEAAAVVLQSILGEDVLLDKIEDFGLSEELEPRFADRERPIALLRDAVIGSR